MEKTPNRAGAGATPLCRPSTAQKVVGVAPALNCESRRRACRVHYPQQLNVAADLEWQKVSDRGAPAMQLFLSSCDTNFVPNTELSQCWRKNEGAIRIPLHASSFFFNDLVFLVIPRKSLKFLTPLFSIFTAQAYADSHAFVRPKGANPFSTWYI